MQWIFGEDASLRRTLVGACFIITLAHFAHLADLAWRRQANREASLTPLGSLAPSTTTGFGCKDLHKRHGVYQRRVCVIGRPIGCTKLLGWATPLGHRTQRFRPVLPTRAASGAF